MTKLKYYAVANGRSKGIFDNWDSCNESIKGFSGATYKSFSQQALDLAEEYLKENGVEEIIYNF